MDADNKRRFPCALLATIRIESVSWFHDAFRLQTASHPLQSAFICGQSPLQRFEAIGGAVLAHLGRLPHTAVHDDPHTWRQGLYRADCAADVEDGIGVDEAGRMQGPGHDDDAIAEILQHGRRVGHGVGAMGEQVVSILAGQHGLANQAPVVVAHVQRILAQQGANFPAKGDIHGGQDTADLRLADLVVGLVIVVDLVDRTAGGQDIELVQSSACAGSGMSG